MAGRQEIPIFFDAAGEELFGIFTEPVGQANGTAVLSLWGAGGFPSVGKNQTRIRLAQGLAQHGFHVLRIDYRGIGESGGEPREVDFSQPWVDDAIGAVQWLTGRGFERILIAGLCFGARTALAAADRIPGLAGLALVAPPVGDTHHVEAILDNSLKWYLRRAASPRALRRLFIGEQGARRRRTLRARLTRRSRPTAGASPRLLGELASVLAADVPVLMLYGREDDFYPAFEGARGGELGRLLEQVDDLATVQVVDHHLGGMSSLEAQQTFLDSVISWTTSVAADGLRLD
ncbi:MAG: alpha/beta hydrolase [Acidimicrobiales bacterium]